MFEFPDPKTTVPEERKMQRFYEIIPGTLTWTTFILMIGTSMFYPVAAALFIIVFDVYWIMRVIFITYYSVKTGHRHVFSITPFPLWLETLGRFLVEVHLHDNHREMDDHLPVGEGSFDFDQFFGLLSKMKLNPIYTLEPHQEDHLWRGLKAIQKYISTKSQASNSK